ncbi:MAG: cupin domain-containing protein [Burkholderiales bacterium]
MATQLPAPRRVITGFDASGQSIFESDSLAEAHVNPLRPAMRSYNAWGTSAIPCPMREADQSGTARGIMPPKNGSVLHIVDYPPEPADPIERKKYLEEMRERVKKVERAPEPGVRRYPDGPHPGMHETDTIDYAIVMSGEIWAIMDKGETLLKTGDILMQRGTSHGWSNRSNEYCRVAFVLVEATR